MANYKRRWTTEDRETLVMLHAKGVHNTDIGKLLNRTSSAISSQIHVLKKRKAAVKELDLFAVDTIPYPVPTLTAPKVPKEAETTTLNLEFFNMLMHELGCLRNAMERENNFTLWQRVFRKPYKPEDEEV